MQALPESVTTEHQKIMVYLRAYFVCHAVAYFGLNVQARTPLLPSGAQQPCATNRAG